MNFIKRPVMKPKQLGASDPLYNPPAYYQTMATDPTQVPTQIYPYGSGGSGTPGMYGPYPGFYFGQRTFEKEDADRMIREQAEAMVRRSETSSDPKDKYINAEGRLNPGVAAALQRAKQAQRMQQTADPLAAVQKKVLITVLLSSVLAALLR
jgi:hypothetical protein